MTPPDGSKIELKSQGGNVVVEIPYTGASVFRYFLGTFMLLWLGGWYFGFASALEGIRTGELQPFIIIWLVGWILGGLFALWFTYRLFRPQVPERLTLSRPEVKYDSGVPPLRLFFGWGSQMDFWRMLFPKRRRLEFAAKELSTLKLRETDAGNRLTIDVGADRIDLASGASEVEREWLFDLLQREYSGEISRGKLD